jgi:hypothetical protein
MYFNGLQRNFANRLVKHLSKPAYLARVPC